MKTGVTIHKQERVYHGKDYYLISLGTVESEDKKKHFVTNLLNGYKDLDATEYADLDEAEASYNKTVEEYRTASKEKPAQNEV